MKTKNTLRTQLIQQRNNLTSQEQHQLNLQICDKILSSTVFKNSNSIALYLSINNEVNINCITKIKKNTYVLPVIHKQHKMAFNRYQNQNELIKNSFGILEPKNTDIINVNEIDLCLLPLVGFNRQGVRLGMGGGYYDRYFETNKAHKKPTILAGVAYDFQEDATIQAEAWDIPLDIIFTNKEVITP